MEMVMIVQRKIAFIDNLGKFCWLLKNPVTF